jgi:alkyl sulfatase BDS1-like metallo-beta-lactamase superfamily hydrolase
LSQPLYRSRPGGFDIRPASGPATRINDFIWLSEGLSNSYLIVTDAGRVVINTGMGFEAPVHRHNYDAVDGGPVRYILLTQGHVDHVGGVDVFREADTEILAQAGNAAHQADDARIARFRASRSAFAFSEAIQEANRYVRENLGARIPPQSRPTPTRTFEDHACFELAELRFELLATPGGETTDSMVVWLPQHGICFTGNLFSALFGHFPNLVTMRGDRYREAPRFVESLDRVLALEPEMLLVGHHGPVQGRSLIRRELERLRAAVLYVHDETVRGMNAGTDLFTLMREIRLPPELEVGEGYGKVDWSVRAIWETYAGWFQHRSTRELYPLPPEGIYDDLVELAGGPAAVCERARARLGAGDLVEAIELAEVALAADPAHAEALAVSLAAHEQLEAGSQNFWLTAWLRRQQHLLGQRLREVEGEAGT